MKKSFIILATIAIAIIAAAAVSCKKDKQEEPTNNERVGLSTSTFTPPKVDDMNTYLKDFKLRMESRGDELMNIDEAAWHLSCLANHDFCNVNVEYNDIRFDTLYCQVELSDGQVSLQDLSAVYSDISHTIEAFDRSLFLENKHFRFIDTKITPTGQIIVPILTTYVSQTRYLYDTLWYFDIPEYNTYYIDSLWAEYFDSHTVYTPNGLGKTELVRYLNLIESHSTNPSTHHQIYYTPTTETLFYFRDYIDPYGSPFISNSRLYAAESTSGSDIGVYNMLYLLDSYAGLGYQACPQGNSPISWSIIFHDKDDGKADIRNHELDVIYGTAWGSPNNPPQD